jgi:hypothetical protein
LEKEEGGLSSKFIQGFGLEPGYQFGFGFGFGFGSFSHRMEIALGVGLVSALFI